MTIRRILFPVDFSEGARAVAPFVLSLAQRHKASVALMNVFQPLPPLSTGLITVYPETFDFAETREILVKNLNEFAAAQLPGVEATCAADMGDPASSIIRFAEGNGIDLICMPTHGHGVFRRALLGSVTAKVLHDAGIPVWMSAHAPEASDRAHPQPRHILVALDPATPESARATLDASVAIAGETNATLDIVTAASEGTIAPGMADADVEDLLIEATREALAKLQFEAGTGAGTIIEIGNPAKIVRAAALAKRSDLVVSGRNHTHGILGRLRDNSYAIIREAPCPVLSV